MAADRNRIRLLISSLVHTALPIAIPMLILSLMIWHAVNTGVTREVDSANRARLDQYALYIDNEFSSLEHLESILSANPTIRFRLRNIFRDNGLISYDEYLAMDTASDFLYSSILYSSIAESIYIYFPNNEGWFFSSEGGLTTVASDRDSLWFTILESLDDDDKSWSGFRSSSWLDASRVFSIIKPISPSGGWSEGALILNTDPDDITDMLHGLMENESGDIITVDEEGNLLFTTLSGMRLAYDLVNAMEGRSIAYSDGMVLYSTSMPHTGWHAVLAIPQEDAYRINSLVKLLIAVLTAVVLFISLVISVKRTEEELASIAMLKNELSENGGRQQKTLYSKLSKDIYRTFLEIRKLNDRKRELELTALSLQLTPHFLFNTLQVIKWKAIALSGGENDASLMIGDLSSLLGYVLGDRKLFTTLDEEIAATEAYIAIQGRRFNDEFTAVWNIGEGVDGGILIPKMILQPLVENAISHGIREAGRPGRLRISIFINRGRELKVRIIDNGKGIERDKLRRIKRSVRKSGEDISIGLGNVSSRLGLLFDPPRVLSIASKEGKGTCVTFSIPLTSDEFRKF